MLSSNNLRAVSLSLSVFFGDFSRENACRGHTRARPIAASNLARGVYIYLRKFVRSIYLYSGRDEFDLSSALQQRSLCVSALPRKIKHSLSCSARVDFIRFIGSMFN